ncbi:MAG: PIN domain-containing protein [Longimonas sp.]|uniref:type II toxin-antitoxin system VapC family toxin n=1 Tax=Longimonas sp. TaxID=2039626 RepID=UPI00334D9CA5
MAKTKVLIDTGPLLALLSKRDQYHRWAKQQAAHLEWPFYTCEAVISEVTHLLERMPVSHLSIIHMLERGLVEVSFSYAKHAERIHDLMSTYADQPMSFADACLVQMAEHRADPAIFTTDSDFQVYRGADGNPLNVRMPNA